MAEAHSAKKRKFECPFCNRKFNSSTNFYTHRKNRHPTELAALQATEAAERRKRRIEAGVEQQKNDGDGDDEDDDEENVSVRWDERYGDDDDDEEDEEQEHDDNGKDETYSYMIDLEGDAVLKADEQNDVDEDDIMVELIEMDEQPDAS